MAKYSNKTIVLNKPRYIEYLKTPAQEIKLENGKLFCATHKEHPKEMCEGLCSGGYKMAVDSNEYVTVPPCVKVNN